jgi:hypothetical protein
LGSWIDNTGVLVTGGTGKIIGNKNTPGLRFVESDMKHGETISLKQYHKSQSQNMNDLRVVVEKE